MKQYLRTIEKQRFTNKTLKRCENRDFGKPFAMLFFAVRKVVISDVTGLPNLSDAIKSSISIST